ncbi:MAG: EI24 domain-containing protein [Syntrophobacteraceae bacterium]
MIGFIKGFIEGVGFHARGVRFGLEHRSLLVLAVLPLIAALIIYATAFHFFAANLSSMLHALWRADPGSSSRVVGWLYWAYMNILKYLIDVIMLGLMAYTFIIFVNILGIPFYDRIASEMKRICGRPEATRSSGRMIAGSVLMVREEVKKTLLILFLPPLLLLVPLAGAAAAFVIAPLFTAWDYADYALSRDHILLRERLRVVWRRKAHLLGFGAPLLVPFFGLILLPFAILGATLLYLEKFQCMDGNGSQ